MEINLIKFTKMHGLGNDYIYVNAFDYDIQDPSAASVAWSRYHTGIGSDGLVLICPSQVADFRMRMFNADGSEGKMCGNASRCIAKYVYERGLTTKTEITLETLSGIKRLQLHVDGGVVRSVTVDMGEPLLQSTQQVATPSGDLADVKISALGQDFEGKFVSMGNPHFVIFIPDMDAIELEKLGPVIENHPLFPERINTEFVQILPDGSLRMRVWERGSGITMACGTGACATGVAAFATGRCGERNLVRMQGGDLEIEWRQSDGHVYMTGPAEFVFDGIIKL